MPKGTGQGSVAAGSNPASTLLHYATNSDFAPKPNRPERPITIPSAPPMLRLQLQFRNGYFAKHLQPLRNCNAIKCNCSTFKAARLVAMQFQAMQPQAETKVEVETNICPRTPQQVGAKANADPSTSPSETRKNKAFRHRCNPSATPLQGERHGNTNANVREMQV